MIITRNTFPSRHVLLVTALVMTWPAQSAVFSVRNKPPPQIQLTIGSGGSQISEVKFNVTASELGNGTPVRGNPPVRSVVANRATPN